MITKDSPFSDFVKILTPKEPCEDAVVWVKKFSETFPKATFADAMIDYEDKNGHQDMWHSWVVTTLGAELSEEIRKWFYSMLAPITAMQIYIQAPYLTSAEDIVLISKFEGKLPQAEKELLTIVRAKDG